MRKLFLLYIILNILSFKFNGILLAQNFVFNQLKAYMEMWEAIRKIGNKAPMFEESTFSVLGVNMVKKRENKYYAFYEGGRVIFSNKIEVANVDLRLRLDGNKSLSFLVLNLKEEWNCVNLKEVKLYYPNLKVTDSPRGRSENEVTSYTSTETWGEISFSFKEKNPDCLSSISFEPKAE